MNKPISRWILHFFNFSQKLGDKMFHVKHFETKIPVPYRYGEGVYILSDAYMESISLHSMI